MEKTATNILSLNHEEVIDFLMKLEQYHRFDAIVRLKENR